MEIKEKDYKEFRIHYFNDKELLLGRKIIDKDYSILKIFKDTKRNYVVLISIDGQKYVFKEPRNEFRLMQRKIMTFLKNGEAVTTLKNIRNNIEKYNINEYVVPYVAITKRNLGMISYSGLLMEYCDGKEIGLFTKEKHDYYRNEIIKVCMKINSINIYHGDMNVWNFYLKDNMVKILDTQGKKMLFGNYRSHYDMITFIGEHFESAKYPYNKNIFYYIALFMKKFKRFKFIKTLRSIRHRSRGDYDEKNE